jgi:hypothetical protein
MTLNWTLFVPALLLLFYPLDRLLPKVCRLRQLGQIDFMESGVWKRAPWWFTGLWVDGIRAFGGAWLLRAAWSIEPVESWVDYTPMIASALILLIAIGVQMTTRRSGEYFLAPLTYVAGVVMALVSTPVALIVLAAGSICMAAFGSLTAFFFIQACVLGSLGCLILNAGPWAVVATGLGFLPCVVSFAAGRPLVVPMKATGSSGHYHHTSRLRSVRTGRARPRETASGAEVELGA